MCVWDLECDKRGDLRIARGGLMPISCKMRQLFCNMGLECMGICIHASKAITLSTVFFPKDWQTHVYLIYCILYIILNIFLFFRLKINHIGKLRICMFILGTFGTAANKKKWREMFVDEDKKCVCVNKDNRMFRNKPWKVEQVMAKGE